MARQNVGNPKFYIDYLSYWKAKGLMHFEHQDEGYQNHKLIGLNPTDYIDEEFEYPATGYAYMDFEYNTSMYMPRGESDKFWFGFFGHNFNAASLYAPQINFVDRDMGTIHDPASYDEICNWTSQEKFRYNGWSMSELTNSPQLTDSFNRISISLGETSPTDTTTRTIIGAIGFGYVYQMPHSPDLSVTITREYDGVKEQETIGGASLTQVDYFGASAWAGSRAWELFNSEQANYNTNTDNSTYDNRFSARGRRVWNLKFSYVGYRDLFPVNEMVYGNNPTDSVDNEDYDSEDHHANSNFSSSNVTSDSFMSNVMEKTIGGALPFIFQPDGNNNSPDQFAICKLDQNSFKFKQVAHNVYDVSLKIREVW